LSANALAAGRELATHQPLRRWRRVIQYRGSVANQSRSAGVELVSPADVDAPPSKGQRRLSVYP
jgi:hypothetical protein